MVLLLLARKSLSIELIGIRVTEILSSDNAEQPHHSNSVCSQGGCILPSGMKGSNFAFQLGLCLSSQTRSGEAGVVES